MDLEGIMLSKISWEKKNVKKPKPKKSKHVDTENRVVINREEVGVKQVKGVNSMAVGGNWSFGG